MLGSANCVFINTVDNFVERRATPNTRASTKKNLINQFQEDSKDHTTMTEVSRALHLIHKDLAPVRAKIKKKTNHRLE